MGKTTSTKSQGSQNLAQLQAALHATVNNPAHTTVRPSSQSSSENTDEPAVERVYTSLIACNGSFEIPMISDLKTSKTSSLDAINGSDTENSGDDYSSLRNGLEDNGNVDDREKK